MHLSSFDQNMFNNKTKYTHKVYTIKTNKRHSFDQNMFNNNTKYTHKFYTIKTNKRHSLTI